MQSTHGGHDDTIRVEALWRVLVSQRRRIAAWTLGVTAFVAAFAALYLLLWQPVTVVATLAFRPAFPGAGAGEYPNGLPFSPTDIIAGSVLDEVFERNELGACSRQAFGDALFVENRSMALAFLEADYRSRLADTRLTTVERERLQLEFSQRSSSLPVAYSLVLVKPTMCHALDGAVLRKVMSDILAVWAAQTEERRGAFGHRVSVLPPATLDVGTAADVGYLVRADMVRTALTRITDSAKDLMKVPGAQLISIDAASPAPVSPAASAGGAPARVSFASVLAQLQDLIDVRLLPILRPIGPVTASDRLWVESTLGWALREQQAAEARAAVFRGALREFSGTSSPSRSAVASRMGPESVAGPADFPTLQAQLDQSFIDRLVEMSSATTDYRRELTRSLVTAEIESLASRARVAHYSALNEVMRSDRALAGASHDAQLADIVATGKVLATQLGRLYDEFSRMAFRPNGEIYRVENPVLVQRTRPYTVRMYGATVLSVLLVAFLGSFLYSFARTPRGISG